MIEKKIEFHAKVEEEADLIPQQEDDLLLENSFMDREKIEEEKMLDMVADKTIESDK